MAYDHALAAGRRVGTLPQVLGIEIVPESGRAAGAFTVGRQHMAPNGYVHAASIVALADSACGMGCMASLPQGATSFTTIELKSNYLGTAEEGMRVTCEARLAHEGRTTQVWDAEARNEATGKIIALFRCTQLVLYPKG